MPLLTAVFMLMHFLICPSPGWLGKFLILPHNSQDELREANELCDLGAQFLFSNELHEQQERAFGSGQRSGRAAETSNMKPV